MSTPDIETDLRALFAGVADAAPEVHRAALGDLSAPVRGYHPWLRRTAPLAAAACVAGALVASFSLGGTGQRDSGSATPASPATTPSVQTTAPLEPADQTAALMGTWVPVQVEGQVVGSGYVEQPYLEFDPQGYWAGSGGCTALGGKFELGTHPGEINIGLASRRGVRCSDDLAQPTDATTRYRVTGDSLELFDKGDHLLATYRRHAPFVHRGY